MYIKLDSNPIVHKTVVVTLFYPHLIINSVFINIFHIKLDSSPIVYKTVVVTLFYLHLNINSVFINIF